MFDTKNEDDGGSPLLGPEEDARSGEPLTFEVDKDRDNAIDPKWGFEPPAAPLVSCGVTSVLVGAGFPPPGLVPLAPIIETRPPAALVGPFG